MGDGIVKLDSRLHDNDKKENENNRKKRAGVTRKRVVNNYCYLTPQ